MSMYGEKRVVVECTEKGPVVQSQRDEVDINKIIARFERSGVLPSFRQGIFADVSEVGDYRECLEKVQLAREGFDSLDAKIRARFDNDPGKLIEFLSDDANREEAIALGLVEVPEGGAGAPASSAAAPSSPEGAS